ASSRRSSARPVAFATASASAWPSTSTSVASISIPAALAGDCYPQKPVKRHISEPKRGRRRWKGKAAEQQAVYANRRRMSGERGRGLARKRGEMVERPMAHAYETGGMRRTHVRGHRNNEKRLLAQHAALN